MSMAAPAAQAPLRLLLDYLGIFIRRWKLALVPFLLVLTISLGFALLAPPVYRATGTIIVESQQIPDDLVRSTITSFADERIELIKRHVMTRDNLLKVINKYELFAEQRRKRPLSELVGAMRERIQVELIRATAGQRGKATIAFTVSFDHSQPRQAFNTADELVRLFLDENVRSRIERASETTDFLSQEARKLKQRLDDVEQEIAAYKQTHSDALPEHLDLYLDSLQRAEADLRSTIADIKSAEEERRYLEVELDAAASGGPGNPQDAESPVQELTRLKSELISLSSRYGPDYPDVRQLERRVAALKKEVDPAHLRADLAQQLETAREELQALSRRYSGGHPDLKAGRAKVVALEAELAALPEAGTASSRRPMSPLETRIQAKIASADARIVTLQAQRRALEKRIAELEAVIVRIPQVERGLQSLVREQQSALRVYQEVRAKEMDAQLAENLEADNKAERFALLEPPLLPETPVSPNRPRLLALGLMLAVAAACSVLLIELMRGSVLGAARLTQVLGQTPIVEIPYIITDDELLRVRRRWLLGAVLSLVAMGVVLALVYFL